MNTEFRKSGWYGGRSGDLEAQTVKATNSKPENSETSVWDILVTIFLVLIILS